MPNNLITPKVFLSDLNNIVDKVAKENKLSKKQKENLRFAAIASLVLGIR